MSNPVSSDEPAVGRYGIEDLRTLMARLRDPETGCPWDLRQTFRSILPHTLEEAHEVADAIEREDYPHLRDELGDLLFQVISRRYEQGAMVITSNKAFKDWPEIFNNDSTLTSAILDRLLHHAETVVIQGKSYRMKEKIEI